MSDRSTAAFQPVSRSVEPSSARPAPTEIFRAGLVPGAERQAPQIVADVVASAGHPLDPQLRDHAEGVFAHDFSRVRVHTDGRAAESARQIAARAYTLGEHVVFASGAYRPDTADGRGLALHELTHVVQQSGTRPPSKPVLGAAGGHSEHEARAAARGTATGPITVARMGTPVVARTPDQGDLAALSDIQLQEEYGSVLSRLGSAEASTAEAAELTGYAQRLRAAIDLRSGAGAVSRQPTPGDLTQHVMNQRGFSSAAPRRGSDTGVNRVPAIDPAGVGSALGPGYHTNGAVMVVDQSGKQVATELGRFSGRQDAHAEGQGANALQARLPAGSARGGRIVVAVDQVPCPACQARLRALTEHLGCEAVEAYGPVRGSMTGSRDVTPKTAARTATMGRPEGAAPRPVTRTGLLWGETVNPRSGPGSSAPSTPGTPPVGETQAPVPARATPLKTPATPSRPGPAEPSAAGSPAPRPPDVAVPETGAGVGAPKAPQPAEVAAPKPAVEPAVPIKPGGTTARPGFTGAIEGIAGKGFAFLSILDVARILYRGSMEVGQHKWIIDPKRYFKYQMETRYGLSVEALEGKVISEDGQRYLIKDGLPVPVDENNRPINLPEGSGEIKPLA